MKILVLNCGSSSIKYALYNMDNQSVLTSGGIEKIGLPDSFIKIKLADGRKVQIDEPIPEHTKGVKFILQVLTEGEYAVLGSLNELDAVGHRTVHGGEKFNKSVLLTDEVMKEFAACNDLAPLHNPANIKGIDAVKELLPEIPQVGVLILHSIRLCLTMRICTLFLMNFIQNTASVVMVSMEQAIAMCQSAYANFSELILKRQKSLLAI